MPLYRNTGTNRFCPDINNWNEFNQYEIGDGYIGSVQPNRNQYNTISKEGDRRMRPPPIEPDRPSDY
jgi:hypothetical protein